MEFALNSASRTCNFNFLQFLAMTIESFETSRHLCTFSILELGQTQFSVVHGRTIFCFEFRLNQWGVFSRARAGIRRAALKYSGGNEYNIWIWTYVGNSSLQSSFCQRLQKRVDQHCLVSNDHQKQDCLVGVPIHRLIFTAQIQNQERRLIVFSALQLPGDFFDCLDQEDVQRIRIDDSYPAIVDSDVHLDFCKALSEIAHADPRRFLFDASTEPGGSVTTRRLCQSHQKLVFLLSVASKLWDILPFSQ